MSRFRPMRMNHYLFLLLAVSLLACAGCGKSDKGTASGVPAKMDFAKFQQAFPAATPAQLACIREASDDIRHQLYPAALVALEKLASDSTLTEPQVKAVNDLIQGVKEVLAKAPAPSA
jgi:hypothetical protein